MHAISVRQRIVLAMLLATSMMALFLAAHPAHAASAADIDRLVTAMMALSLAAQPAHAASTAEIDGAVDQTLAAFRKVEGANAFLGIAKGVLVFPKGYKARSGGKYGDGALRVDGRTVDYYSTAAASHGFQLGAQAKSIVILFVDADALKKFRSSAGWKVGVDGSVALVDIGVGKMVDTNSFKDPVIGFVFGQKGLMYNPTLQGSRFTKRQKK